MNRLRPLALVLALALGPCAVAPAAHAGQATPAEPSPEAAAAPSEDAPPPRAPVTEAEVDALRAELEAAVEAGTVEAGTAEGLSGQLEQVRAEVVRRRELEQAAAEFRRSAEAAPTRLASINAELEQPPATPEPEVPEDAGVAQLEQRRAEVEAALGAAREQAARLQTETAERRERLDEIASEIAAVREQAVPLRDLLASSTPPEDAGLADRIARLRDAARLQALLAREATLRAEAASYEVRAGLLPARRALALRRVQELEALLNAWAGVISEARRQEAARAAEEAARMRAEAARSDPVLSRFAARTAELADRRTGEERYAARTELTRDRIEERATRLAELRESFDDVRERLEVSGLNRATGLLLRREFETLPDARDLRRRVGAIQDTIEEVLLERIEYEDQEQDAVDVDAQARGLLAEIRATRLRAALPPPRPTTVASLEPLAAELSLARLAEADEADLRRIAAELAPLDLAGSAGGAVREAAARLAEQPPEAADPEALRAALVELSRSLLGEAEATELRRVAIELARARRDTLAALIDDAEAFRRALEDSEQITATLAEATEAFDAFIRERILWTRSIQGTRGMSLADLRAALRWALDVEGWIATGRAVLVTVAAEWPRVLVSFGAVAALFGFTPRIRRRIRRRGRDVTSFRTDAFTHSVETLGLTILLALPLPLLLATVGWLLRSPIPQARSAPPTDSASLTRQFELAEQLAIAERVGLGSAFGDGLFVAAILLLPYRFLAAVIRPNGLADAHFRWPAAALRAGRRHLRWFLWSAVPAVVLTIAAVSRGTEVTEATLGRVAFTATMVLFAVVLQRMLRPSGPVLADWFRRHRGSWADRLKYAWYPLLVAAPLAFAIMSWLGWFYTALSLLARTQWTLVLAFLLVVANGFLLRWLFIARRRVAIEDARRRREQAIAEAKARARKEAGAEDASREAAPAAIDEDTLNLPAISAQTKQIFRTLIVLTLVVGLYLTWVDVAPALRALDRVQVWPSAAVLDEGEDVSIPVLEPPATGRDAEARARVAGDDGAAAAAGGGAGGSTSGGDAAAAGNGAGGGGTGDAGAPVGAVPIPGTNAGTGVSPPDAATDAATPAPPFSLTLADLGFALVVLVLTVVATRNVPGLVEIAILQRLPVDAAARYAIGTVIRYLIVIVGTVVAFGSIGVTWSKLQWLAAALTFGLAFGLQEIFANFISGLIILAERPVRVGDTVTVGGVSGVVTRIRMRATTITDWDRKELVIPNKTFITSDVINWTLSDPTLRITIPVGVSYGADVDRARSLLLEIAERHPNVLADPGPQALFLGFGDSTLNFELRVFIPSIEVLLATKSELHMIVLKEFRAADIEIAFPQRDLHVRSIGDLARLVDRGEVAVEPAE